MTYLAIDIAAARSFVRVLRTRAALVAQVQGLLRDAENLSELSTGAPLLLDDVDLELSAVAHALTAAADQAAAYRLTMPWKHPPAPIVEPPTRPLWDATPETRWNEVHQDASHNSYEVVGGILDLFASGVRTFELDLHRGAPTDFSRPFMVLADHFDHAGGRPDDWRVYHISGSAESEYEYLSDGLEAVGALTTRDPITVFLDLKDAFGQSHSGAQLDDLLVGHFGERLFSPVHLLARAPGAKSLAEAVAIAGWPTTRELEGRVLIVLTDEIGGYHVPESRVGAPLVEAALDGSWVFGRAFVAPAPEFDRDGHGKLKHLVEPNAVFYNADVHTVDVEAIRAIQLSGAVLRTYDNVPCGSPTFDPALGPDYRSGANYRAADVFGADVCPAPGPHPPEGTPVPIATSHRVDLHRVDPHR